VHQNLEILKNIRASCNLKFKKTKARKLSGIVALKTQNGLKKIDELAIKELISCRYNERSLVKVFVYRLIKEIYDFRPLQDHLHAKAEIALLKDVTVHATNIKDSGMLQKNIIQP
jgi:hypothetical protein